MCILTHTWTQSREWGDDAATGRMCLLLISQPFPGLHSGFFSMLFCVSMPALIVVIDWLSWCCRIQNNNSGGSSSGKRREHWVNLRREETTLVICQLWASYNKLGIAIFIVLKWKMQAEPGRSILNTLCWALACGHPEKKPFFLHIELFLTHLIPPVSARGLTTAIPSLPLGCRGFPPACPWCDHLLLFTCTEMEEVLLTQHLLPSGSRVPFPGVSPLLAEDQWNPLRLHSCTSYQGKGGGDSFPEAMFLLGKKTPENSKMILELFPFVTFLHHPFISCDLLSLLTPLLLLLS